MLLWRRSPSVEMKYRRPIFQHTTHWDLICFDFVPRRHSPQRGSARHSWPRQSRHTRITRCKVRISTLSSVHTCTCTLLTFVARKKCFDLLNFLDFFDWNKIVSLKFYDLFSLVKAHSWHKSMPPSHKYDYVNFTWRMWQRVPNELIWLTIQNGSNS